LALAFETGVHWIRRDVAAKRERATEAIALSEAQGFPMWLGVGRAWHAAARVGRLRRAPRNPGRHGARRRDGKPTGRTLYLGDSGRSTASRRPARRVAGHGSDR